MEVVVIGANGQLGTDLCSELQGVELISLTRADIEVTSFSSVKNALSRCQPHVIINTAGYVRVDDCETHQDEAYSVNALGARNVAVVAEELGAKLMQTSTDYVFGGESEPHAIPYTEFDVPAPLNVYGRSMLAGEDFVKHLCHRHFIVRSSGLFGVAGSRGKGGNFVETILRLARENGEVKVVNDQVSSPTYTRDLAKKMGQLIGTEYYGIFHITNNGACSWFDFARTIVGMAGLSARIIPIKSSEYQQKTPRPGFSVLDNYHLRLLGMDDMRPLPEALRDYLLSKGYLQAETKAGRQQ